MKNQILFLLILIGTSLSFYVSAQTVGDYRSNAATFNWDVDASWQRWNGAAWADPTVGGFGYPGENATGIAGTVTIQNGHTVRATVDVTTNDIGNLTLVGSGILNFNNNGIDIEATGNLSMDATSQIQGGNPNRTLKIGGTFNVPASATNARIGNITLTVTGNTTVSGTLVLSSPNLVMNLSNLSILGAGILNMSSSPTDVNVAGNLMMDATSQIQGNSTNCDIQVAGAFTVPITATNVRVAGISLTVTGASTVAGTIVFTSNTGTKTFNGSVNIAGSWTSTAINSNNRLVFGGEVITSGTFACGCN